MAHALDGVIRHVICTPHRGRSAFLRPFKAALAIASFVGPFLIFLSVFQYWPLVQMITDSMFSFELLNPDAREFVGLGNYWTVFSDPDIRQSFSMTFVFAFGVALTILPCAFLLAVYLNGKLPARALVRTIVFLPVVTSSVVVATMWTFLLDPTNGLVNGALASFGIGPLEFLTSKTGALPALIVMTLWQQLGFATVLFLSGLQGIPKELDDAARVDGATASQRMRYITIPLLSRTTVFVVVIVSVFSLQAFAPPMIMTSGGPEGTTNFVVYNLYETAFSLQQPGLASAISAVLLVVVLLISLLQMRLLRTRWRY
jgi:ABC-type sugar transport system permease subunit